MQLLMCKVFATHRSGSFGADHMSTIKECTLPSHRLRDKFAAREEKLDFEVVKYSSVSHSNSNEFEL
ncbi:hypothetical protein D918_00667 [Trichuris suis]|nr:hypothetical protein D918_00667 [Trichuris suis]